MDQAAHSQNAGAVPQSGRTMPGRMQSVGWVLLLLAVFTCFFHECIFYGYTLLPTDMLHQLVQPFGESVPHPVVQNHYTLDTLEQDYPWAELWQKTVREGKVPLWNPAVCGGEPHVATSMGAVFSPFKLLLLWLGIERGWSLGLVLEFMLAGIFMFAFLRELGRSPCASFIGACAFGLNSNLLAWYWREPSAFVWVPLVLFLFERSLQRDSWSYTLAAGFALGLAFLGNNVQSAFHVAFLCSLYWMLTAPWGDPSRRNAAVLRIAVALLIGVCLSAVQWLPTLELMKHDASGRVQDAGPRPSVVHTLLGLPFCLSFVFSGLTGSSESYDLLKVIHAALQDFTAYVGVVPFTMFLIGATDFREKRVRAWLIIVTLVFIVIFFTPLVSYVYHRFFIVAAFGVAVVAAYGTDFVLDKSREHPTRVRRAFLWMMAACVVLGLGLIFMQIFVHLRRAALLEAGQRYIMAHAETTVFSEKRQWLLDRLPLFLDHYRLSNILFWLPISSVIAAAIGWWAYAYGRISRGVLCAMLVVLTVCDLTSSGRQIVPQVSLQKYPLYPSLPVLAKAQEDPDLFRIQRWPLRLPGFLLDNMLMVYGLNTASGYESLAPANLESFLGATNDEDLVLLDLANVKYLLARYSVDLPPEHFELVTDTPTLRLYRNKRWLPRAQFVTDWQVVPDRHRVMTLMQSPGFDPRKTVFLEQEPPPAFAAARTNAGETPHGNCPDRALRE